MNFKQPHEWDMWYWNDPSFNKLYYCIFTAYVQVTFNRAHYDCTIYHKEKTDRILFQIEVNLGGMKWAYRLTPIWKKFGCCTGFYFPSSRSVTTVFQDDFNLVKWISWFQNDYTSSYANWRYPRWKNKHMNVNTTVNMYRVPLSKCFMRHP